MLRSSKEGIFNQTYIIAMMQSVGYQSNRNGVCYGITFMAVQAFLANDLKTFCERLNLINRIGSIAESKLGYDISDLDKKFQIENKNLNSEHRTPSEWVKKLNALEKKYTELKEAYIQEFFKEIQLQLATQSNELITDLNAFFDGVELYHQGRLYPHLFPGGKFPSSIQSAELSSPLVLSKELEKQNGTVFLNEQTITSTYTIDTLTAYFKSLSESLSLDDDTSGLNGASYPITIHMGNYNHAVFIGYEPKQKKWTFIDSENLPPVEIQDDKTIAQYVMKAFSENEHAIISSDFIVTNLFKEDFVNRLKKWREQDVFKNIHQITKEKSLQTDSHGANWLWNATYFNQLDVVKLLLEKTSKNINDCPKNSIRPLALASEKGFYEIAKLLLEYGANPVAGSIQNSAIELANKHGHEDIVNLITLHLFKYFINDYKISVGNTSFQRVIEILQTLSHTITLPEMSQLYSNFSTITKLNDELTKLARNPSINKDLLAEAQAEFKKSCDRYCDLYYDIKLYDHDYDPYWNTESNSNNLYEFVFNNTTLQELQYKIKNCQPPETSSISSIFSIFGVFSSSVHSIGNMFTWKLSNDKENEISKNRKT